jgi:hypothetical protein
MELIYTDFNGNTERIPNVKIVHLTEDKASLAIKHDRREDCNSIQIYNMTGKIIAPTKITLQADLKEGE